MRAAPRLRAIHRKLHLALALRVGSAGMDAVLASYAALLAKYVTPNGVRYDAWRGVPADVKSQSEVVAALGAADSRKLRSAEKYARYINLYNAKVLQIVLEERPQR